MSIIVSKYDKTTNIDKCWYDSSNILYSETTDKKDDYKDVKIVFKAGNTYLYEGVIIQDYLLFKNGGLDGSQGKAFNKYMKKYSFKKLDNTDLTKLNEEKEKAIEEQKQLLQEQINLVKEPYLDEESGEFKNIENVIPVTEDIFLGNFPDEINEQYE